MKIPVFTTAVKLFVLGKGNSAESDLHILPNETFVAECEGLAYLKVSVISEKILFRELHEISLVRATTGDCPSIIARDLLQNTCS